jgi:hypothetical protein
LSLAAAAMLAACPAFDSESDDPGGQGPPQGGGGDIGECAVNSDCMAAGPTCCECPTHALPGTSDSFDACDDASNCELPADCAITDAVCSAGQCVLQCAAISCDLECEAGFRADDFGCLTCECEEPLTDGPMCIDDLDCIQAPADCCGCARGGADTAVPASELDTFLGGLDCGSQPACPDVDVCDATSEPRCVNGSCQLTADDGLDGGEGADGGAPTPQPAYCGTPEYPPCPAGSECVLNDPDANDANMAGVGVCHLL